MASTTYNDVLSAARTIIAASTPAVESSLLFEEAPMTGPLDRMQFGSSHESTRKFHVTHGTLRGAEGIQLMGFNGGLLHLSDTFMVEVMYWCPLRDDGWRRLNDLISTDSQLLVHRLTWRDADWESAMTSDTRPSRVDPRSVQILPITRGAEDDTPDRWIMRITLRTQTFLGE
jgi:hypothetical protein